MNIAEQLLEKDFNAAAKIPGASLELFLADKINAKTARAVTDFFRKAQMPLPYESGFITGTEGALVFSNTFGVVIRIEHKEPRFRAGITRYNDNPMIIQPLGSFEVEDAVIEICPGCHTYVSAPAWIGWDNKRIDILYDVLQQSAIDFWDDSDRNIGVLPFKTPVFPEGVPVVIDRLAVSQLSEGAGDVKKLLEKIGLSEDPQKALYAPLRTALAEVWPEGQKYPDSGKLHDFWRLCASFVREGKLVAGWNESYLKAALRAQDAASSYDKQLARFYPDDRAPCSDTPAKAPSPAP